VFDSEAWKTLNVEIVQLKHVYRQTDRQLINILNELRVGRLSDATIETLQQLNRELHLVNLKATHLYPLRAQVDQHNAKELRELKTEEKKFIARDFVKDPKDTKKLNDALLCPQTLELKVGAQVMVVKNLRTNQLFNGSIGRVESFYHHENDPSLDGVYVHFVTCGRTLLITRETFELEKAGQGVYASRHQLPLVLAYAMSIHKSQGQTLPFVHVDLKHIFESGQAYVALSRCTSLQGLVVQNFDPKKVKVNAQVPLY
jgi:ATP-dependent DNA helicase PIF1